LGIHNQCRSLPKLYPLKVEKSSGWSTVHSSVMDLSKLTSLTGTFHWRFWACKYVELLELEMDATHHSIFMPGAGQHIVFGVSLVSSRVFFTGTLDTCLDTHPATQTRSATTNTAKSYPRFWKKKSLCASAKDSLIPTVCMVSLSLSRFTHSPIPTPTHTHTFWFNFLSSLETVV